MNLVDYAVAAVVAAVALSANIAYNQGCVDTGNRIIQQYQTLSNAEIDNLNFIRAQIGAPALPHTNISTTIPSPVAPVTS